MPTFVTEYGYHLYMEMFMEEFLLEAVWNCIMNGGSMEQFKQYQLFKEEYIIPE